MADIHAARDPGLVRIRLILAYDGAGFHGFAPNPGVRTVAGILSEAIGKVVGIHPVVLTCAGRTDTGVHARGQVVHFDTRRKGLDLARLQSALNKMLGPEIVVREVTEVGEAFDARRSAIARVYRYSVLNTPVPDPFLAATSWWVPQPLDLHALILACDPFIGEHDFSSFCRKVKQADPANPPSMRRRVTDARWEDGGEGLLHFWIEASSFCHQMVRSVVGTMVEAGMLKKHAGEIMAILKARDRAVAGALAPPQGLCLWEVRYG